MQTAAIAPGRRRDRRWALAVALAAVLVTVLPAPAHANDPARARQWGLDLIGADTGHEVGQGDGVVIAVVDSGVDLDHEDLVPNLVAGIDVVDDDRTPQDGYGHGTHVAGIAAAAGDNGRGIRGVAPRASIMPVRVLGDDGSGSTSHVVEGIEWAVANGADVINLSLGQAAQGIFGSSLSAAIEDAWAAGAVVVVSAGNDFIFSSGFGDEPAIVVSATTRGDGKPDYSNGVGSAMWGMAAPGGGCATIACSTDDGVFSTYWDEDQDDVYAFLSGTSMAAPHVAGAAAVLLSLGLSPRQTVDRLLATAQDIGASGRDSTFGEGRLDLAAATAGIGAAPSPTAAPTRSPVPTPSATSVPAPTSEPSRPEPTPAAASPQPSPVPASPSASPTPSASPSPVGAASPSPVADGSETPASPPPAGTTRAAGDDQPGDDAGLSLALLALVLVTAAGTGVALAARGARRR